MAKRQAPAIIWLGLISVLSLAGISWGAPPRQTRPWRIAVGGSYVTGYLGLLSLHGLPRERLADTDLSDLNKLRQYNLILLGMRGIRIEGVGPALEEYVREGGVLVAETGFPVSPAILPGRRIGPAPHPNIRFVDSGTPFTAGLPQLGVISCVSGGAAIAIVPDASAKATVLAEFTEEGVPQQRFRGNFLLPGGKGAPAIVLVEYGQGKLIYSAPSIAFSLSLRGQQFEPFILNIVRAISQGEMDDRFYTGTLARNELVSEPPEKDTNIAYPRPAGEPSPVPEGFEKLADPEELTDFALRGKLKAGGKAEILISYWAPQLTRRLILANGQALLQRQEGSATPTTIAQAALPSGELALLIARRYGLLSLTANGQLVLSACDGLPRQGALAVRGLDDAAYQPLAEIFFNDDFMRESSTEEEWQTLQGRWQIMAAEGKPEMGANPFDFAGTATEQAIALHGNWFWSDIAYDVSVKAGTAAAAGLLVHYQAPDDYLMLRLNFGAEGTRLQLLQVKPTGTHVLAEAPVEAKRDDWQRLGLRTSGTIVQGLLDGRVVLQAQQTDSLCGRIGLYCEQGQARFDDIDVRPWTAAAFAGDTPVNQLMIVAGEWRKAEGGLLTATGPKGARAFPRWGESGVDCAAQVEVKVGRAAAAGLHFRYVDANTYYLMALINEHGKLRLRLYRHGHPGAVLVEKPVAGGPERWHRLQAEVRHGRLQAAVDGQPLIDVLDPGVRAGRVGLYARGSQPAAFRNFFAAQVEPDMYLVDAPTPSFAGIIDRHTWAGRSGAWKPDPANLNCFWHQGYFPGDFEWQVGLHPQGQGAETKATLYLTREQRPDSGYALLVERRWAEARVPVVLQRLGKPVLKKEAEVPPGKALAIGLIRLGQQLMIEIDHQPVAVYQDPQPLPNLDCLGLDQHGSPIFADDIAIQTPCVRDYTFERAPTDWVIRQGTWEISSRWSCSPGWAWFSGHNANGFALISTKTAFTGDQEIVMYVAPKMMPAGNNRFSETFGDVYIALCADGQNASSGYQIAFAGITSSMTVLRRAGQIVAQSSYRLPQGGEHNDWLRLMIRKRGAKISAWEWDSKILEYEDTEPLPAGRIMLGTRDNGIMIPRVTIYGRPSS